MECVLIKAKLKYSLFILVLLTCLTAKSQQYTEYDLKAAYLYNFSKFVEWPQSSFETETSKFVITVVGESPITSVLNKALKNKTIMGREISIRVVYDIDELKFSHIVFISKSSQSDLNDVLIKVEGKSMLTVGDVIDNFCQSGGIINFTSKYSKYRFEINNQAALESNLKISSKLLALSRIVSSEEIKF